MNYYTADLHLAHEAVIRVCRRPFSTVEEMDCQIIENIRTRMTVKDDLYIVGDFVDDKAVNAARYVQILKSIPGRKHLISGNHDKKWIKDLPWTSCQPMLEVKDNGRRITLCHYPMITWPGARHGALMFFGHVHDNWLGHRNCINVGVDHWNFAPVTAAEAAARAATLPVSRDFLACEPGLGLEGDLDD